MIKITSLYTLSLYNKGKDHNHMWKNWEIIVMAKYKSGDYSFETSGYIINAMGKFTS